MKLIIDIDEELKSAVYRCGLFLNPAEKTSLINAINNGTSIPDNPLEVLKAFYPNISISSEEDLPTKDMIIRISRSEVIRNETDN